MWNVRLLAVALLSVLAAATAVAATSKRDQVAAVAPAPVRAWAPAPAVSVPSTKKSVVVASKAQSDRNVPGVLLADGTFAHYSVH